MNWKTILAIFAGIVAFAVVLGANLFDLEPVRLLAVSVIALAIAVALPPQG